MIVSPERVARLFLATKTRSEKEEAEAERLIRPSPKKKPPRRDLERGRVNDSEDDPDEKQDKKDRSHNYKDSSFDLVAWWFKNARDTSTVRMRKVDTGRVVDVSPDTVSENPGAYEEVTGDDATDTDDADPDATEDTPSDTPSSDPKGDAPPKPDPSSLPGPTDLPDKDAYEKFRSDAMARYTALGIAEDEVTEILDMVSNQGDAEESVVLLDELADTAAAEKADREKAEKAEAEALQKEQTEAEEARKKEERDKLTKDLTQGLPRDQESALERSLGKLSPEQFQAFSETLQNRVSDLNASRPDIKEFMEDLSARKKDLRESTDPARLGEALAAVTYFNTVVDNPAVDLDNPLPEKGGDELEGDALTEARKKSVERSSRAVEKYRAMSSEDRKRHLKRLDQELLDLPDGSPRRVELEAIEKGLGIAAVLEEGDSVRGAGSAVAGVIRAADTAGDLDKILSLSVLESTDALGSDDQHIIRGVYNNLGSMDFVDVVAKDHPARPLAELLADPAGSKNMSRADRAFMKELLVDALVADTAFLDPLVSGESEGLTVKEHRKKSLKKRKKFTPSTKIPTDVKGARGWFEEFLENLSAPFRKKSSSHIPWDFTPWNPETITFQT